MSNPETLPPTALGPLYSPIKARSLGCTPKEGPPASRGGGGGPPGRIWSVSRPPRTTPAKRQKKNLQVLPQQTFQFSQFGGGEGGGEVRRSCHFGFKTKRSVFHLALEVGKRLFLRLDIHITRFSSHLQNDLFIFFARSYTKHDNIGNPSSLSP